MAERDPKTGRFPKGNGAGKGEGWGGPAKGASASRIRPGDPDGITALRHEPDVKTRQAERAARLHDHLYELATKAKREETQLAATVACLDRIEGKPLQRQDVTSGGERIGYVIAAPDEDESAEAWQERQQPVLQ